METERERELVGIILQKGPIAISSIQKELAEHISKPTLNRALAKLKAKNLILVEGNGPNVCYIINLHQLINTSINVDAFFKIEPDERKILTNFNTTIFQKLYEIEIFTQDQKNHLKNLSTLFKEKIKSLSTIQYKKEFERLMIELSWKSSQIEGNTYDLLDTEQLLKFNVNSEKHTQEETQMLLNHKTAINYTHQNSDLYSKLTISKIIDIHSLLTKKMGISKNPRKRLVRITGSNYLPPGNEFIIIEALQSLCDLVNSKNNIFEKTFLTILLLSYIQPFEDGNKRTARLTANAILMHANDCPLSYRSVKPSEYKKAILLFYELNNITAFKEIFIRQYEFAVENYF